MTSDQGARPDPELGDEAVRHLQQLIRIDTTNPPGNETPAAEYLAELLTQAGLEPTLVGVSPRRQNVVARLRGSGEGGGPLLLNAHLDVVPAEVERWTHPPFSGEIHDGYLWGRGAIDEKHMAVMSALVLARLKREGVVPTRDVIFAGVADEEAGCDQGSRWLVDQHPELVRAEFALGEVGGFSIRLGGQVVYPVMVAEKGVVWMKLRLSGRPGHGSLPNEENAVVRLAEALARLGRERLPHHQTQVVDSYLRALAATQRFPQSWLIKNLHIRKIADLVLGKLPDRGVAAALSSVLANTVVPTVLRAGAKVNVVPGSAEAELDGRSLPGQTSADLVAEVRRVIGEDLGEHVEIEVLRDMPPVETSPDSALYEAIRAAVGRHDPAASIVPYLAPGYTDAKSWSRLGTRSYGFAPVRFPDDGVKFSDLFHGHDERVPVDGLKWGVAVLYDVVRRFAC